MNKGIKNNNRRIVEEKQSDIFEYQLHVDQRQGNESTHLCHLGGRRPPKVSD